MNEYVDDLLFQIAEKNLILDSIDTIGYCRFGQRKRLIYELDYLLYELYKCIIYFPIERR